MSKSELANRLTDDVNRSIENVGHSIDTLAAALANVDAYNLTLVPEIVPTAPTTIAGLDVELPLKFYPGMIFVDVTSKIADAHCQRQFANNRNAAFAAWEKKAKAWDASTAADKGERPANPCTVELLLKDYATYMPKVGEGGQTALERMRDEAALLVLNELLAQHNTAIDAKDEANYVKPFGTVKRALKKGKGAAEEREHWITLIQNSKSLAGRIQTHLDALVLKSKEEAKKPDVEELKVDTAVGFD